MKLDNNVHAVFLLHYHLVLVVKYRRQVFDSKISDRAKEIVEYIQVRSFIRQISRKKGLVLA